MARSLALIALLGIGCVWGVELSANPIRKVVTMLQDMQKTVEAEGEKEKALFENFMCYCNNGAGSLDGAIAQSAAAIDALTGKVEGESAQKSQMQQEVAQHKTDREEAEKTIKESTAMRGKEASEFAATSGEMKANIEAMTGALAALRKGLSSSLLQTRAGQTLRSIIQHSPTVSDEERSTLMSFLETGEGGSDQIIGVVDQMKETLEADLKQSTEDEESAKAGFTTLVAAKEKEIASAGKAVESKTARVGELAVSVVQAKADLEDTKDAMAEDEKFKAELASSCATKSKEWDERQKLRAEEVEAISDTIEMLNGDDALELFKKTLPSASAFLQLSVTVKSQQRRAATLLRRLLTRDPMHSANLKMILLMLNSHMHGGFDKVVKMIDEMVATHGRDQTDDDKKKDFCIAELHKTENQETALKGDVSDLEADIAEREDAIASLKSEIAALQDGLEALDKSVVEATAQRKDEHAEYTSTAASNQACVELIGMAKNRMQKFYQPSLYKAPPTTTASDSPYGFVQLALKRADPGPAPETFKGELKKNEGGGNIIAMMDQMIKDVEMDIQEGKHDEEYAQKDYEEAMKDSADKRATDTKSMVEKQAAAAEEQSNLQTARTDAATKRDQLSITQGKLDDLHIDCDALLNDYDERKKNRATEVDGLKQSKSVLKGASFGFLQK